MADETRYVLMIWEAMCRMIKQDGRMYCTHPRGKYTIAGEILQVTCLVTESACRGATYVEDPQLSPQRPPDVIAALRTSIREKQGYAK